MNGISNELKLINQGYFDYPSNDQGITWPNIGVFFKDELLLRRIFYGNVDYYYSKFDNWQGLYSEKTWSFTMTNKYSNIDNVYFVISAREPKTFSSKDIYDLLSDSMPYVYYSVNRKEYVLNGDTINVDGIKFPNINKKKGTIFFKIEKNRVFSGINIDKSGYICEIEFDKYFYMGIVINASNNECEGDYYFISNNL